MTSKFNKEMYKKIKEKKNEPLSNIGQRNLRFTDKEKERERERKKWWKGVRPSLPWTWKKVRQPRQVFLLRKWSVL